VNCFTTPTSRPDLSPSFLQSNCQSASTTAFARNPLRLSRKADAFWAPGCAHRCQGPVGKRRPAVDAIFTARAAPTTTPCYPDSTSRRHPVSQAGDEIRHKVPYLVRLLMFRWLGSFSYHRASRRRFHQPTEKVRLLKAALPPGLRASTSAAKPISTSPSGVPSVHEDPFLGSLLSTGCHQPVDG